ncbi:MAG: sensory rhodopsin transducer [Armatimonadota bacterium]
MIGHTRWIFPDGDLPPRGDSEPHGHESLVVVNPNTEEAHIRLTIYFPDRDPVRDLTYTIGAERVHCVRMDEPVGDQGYQVPFGQYALMLESTVPVVAQIGRMDVQQPNLAYYTVMGYPG